MFGGVGTSILLFVGMALYKYHIVLASEEFTAHEYVSKCQTFLKPSLCIRKMYGLVQCNICSEHHPPRTQNITFCHADNTINLSMIFQSVPESIEHLVILFNNTWFGKLPLQPAAIDFSEISNLRNLRFFEISDSHHMFYQLYPIVADVDSFKYLTGMTGLYIRMPIITNSNLTVDEMIKNMPHLESLDLSYTRGIGMTHISKLFQSLQSSHMKRICLRKFQLPGGIGYEDQFTIFKTMLNDSITFSELHEIDLSSNALTYISPGISVIFPNLKYLDVSENLLVDGRTEPFYMEALIHPELQVLYYSNQGYKSNFKPKKEMVATDSTSSLKFSWESNQHKNGQGTLQFLSSCGNTITNGNISEIVHAYKFCNFLKCLFPYQYSDLDCFNINMSSINFAQLLNGNCMFFLSIPIGKNLRVVDFSDVHFEQGITAGVSGSGPFCVQSNNLNMISFNNNRFWAKAAKLDKTVSALSKVIGFDNLKVVSIENNSIHLNLNVLKGDLKQLQTLKLSGNNVGALHSNNFCSDVPMLNRLVLNDVNLTTLAKDIFLNCTMLQYLHLRSNKINVESLDELDLNGTTKLRFLDLQHSSIRFLGMNFITKIKAFKNFSVDLSENPLSCTCSQESKKFIKAILNNRQLFYNSKNYFCNGIHGLQFLSKIDDGFWDDCSDVKTVTISVTASLCTALLIISSLLFYNNKWRVRYIMFQIKQLLKRQCFSKRNSVTLWKYDAFISYCAEDRFWVHPTLMKLLEKKYGFKLCIHYRDFLAGAPVIQNIVESMSASREIIVVLSDVAIKSDWCHFELDQALYQIDKRKQTLIIIKLGQINAALLDHKISSLLDAHTYLEWSLDSKQQHVFWATLIGRLYSDPQGTYSCCCPYGANSIEYSHLEVEGSYDKDDDIYLNELTDEDRAHWETAKQAKIKAELADSFKQKLQTVLECESLPPWAYGPLPKPLEDLLLYRQAEIEGQVNDLAYQKLHFLIKCLSDCMAHETEIHISELRKIKKPNV